MWQKVQEGVKSRAFTTENRVVFNGSAGSLGSAEDFHFSTVVPVVDYASNVWMHAFKDKLKEPINRVQRIGAQAIIGTYLTLVTSLHRTSAGSLLATDH